MRKKKWYFVIGVLCFLTAASICVQYRSVHTYTTDGEAAVQSMSENKLRDRVLTEQENYNNLNASLESAQEQLENLRKASSSNSEETKRLEEELTELNRVLGYTEVKGKGLIITLRDADSSESTVVTDSVVHDTDILKIVNELFNAGAEAVSVNDQRIISTSSINCAGNVITINNEKVSVPFIISAIGNPEPLSETLERPYGNLYWLEDRGIRVKTEKVESEDGVVIPKYNGTRQYEYLQVVE